MSAYVIRSITVDSNGTVYVADNEKILKVNGGALDTVWVSSDFIDISRITIDEDDKILVGDGFGHRIMRVDPDLASATDVTIGGDLTYPSTLVVWPTSSPVPATIRTWGAIKDHYR